MGVPEPPDFNGYEPEVGPWEGGSSFVRVYDHEFSSTSFNPGDPDHPLDPDSPAGRFHHFEASEGEVVPVLYGASEQDAAIAEVIFREVPIDGPNRSVPSSVLAGYSMVRLSPKRPLRLVRLYGHGLRRLRVRARNLTDTESSEYPKTLRWAQALHVHDDTIDGLSWMARQFNNAFALVLFGDRVEPGDLAEVDPPFSLLTGRGRKLVQHAANRSDIALA